MNTLSVTPEQIPDGTPCRRRRRGRRSSGSPQRGRSAHRIRRDHASPRCRRSWNRPASALNPTHVRPWPSHASRPYLDRGSSGAVRAGSSSSCVDHSKIGQGPSVGYTAWITATKQTTNALTRFSISTLTNRTNNKSSKVISYPKSGWCLRGDPA